MKKRMFVILLTAAMVMSSLSACQSNESGESKTTTTAEESTLSDTKGGEGEEVTLTIWDWDEAHLTHMTEWYHERHPNVNFNTLVVSTDDYFQNLQSALASGSGAPDIILSEIGYRGV